MWTVKEEVCGTFLHVRHISKTFFFSLPGNNVEDSVLCVNYYYSTDSEGVFSNVKNMTEDQ